MISNFKQTWPPKYLCPHIRVNVLEAQRGDKWRSSERNPDLSSSRDKLPFSVSWWWVHICLNSPDQVPGDEHKENSQTYVRGNFSYQKKIVPTLEMAQATLSQSLYSRLVFKEGISIGIYSNSSWIPCFSWPWYEYKECVIRPKWGPGRETSSSSKNEDFAELQYLPNWCSFNSRSTWLSDLKKRIAFLYVTIMQRVQCVPICPSAWPPWCLALNTCWITWIRSLNVNSAFHSWVLRLYSFLIIPQRGTANMDIKEKHAMQSSHRKGGRRCYPPYTRLAVGRQGGFSFGQPKT